MSETRAGIGRGSRIVLGVGILIGILVVVYFNQIVTPNYALEGEFQSLLDAHVGEVVLLDIMNTECPPCRIEFRNLKEISRMFGDRIVMISVAIEWPLFGEDTDERIQEAIREFEIDWEVVRYGKSTDIIRRYEVWGMPTTVILNREGEVVFRNIGINDLEALSSSIEDTLEEGLTRHFHAKFSIQVCGEEVRLPNYDFGTQLLHSYTLKPWIHMEGMLSDVQALTLGD
ncbi:MAG: TlpA family protein disulfide reductase, partial [Candidatus Geothermarchaeales archaeon]